MESSNIHLLISCARMTEMSSEHRSLD